MSRVYDNVITSTELAHLPSCVHNWLDKCGIIGKENASSMHIKQSGLMRTTPDGKWMNVKACQDFTLDDPSFNWKAKVTMNPFIWFSGKDTFVHGKGKMLIKLYSVLPIVNERGFKIDKGSMLRFLGEMCWFPFAALQPYIQWQEIDALSAKAILRYGATTVDGIFRFDKEGKVISFSAKRYMSKKGKVSLEKWFIPMHEWKVVNGITIPVKGEVVWQLKEGDFTYYKWEVENIDYSK